MIKLSDKERALYDYITEKVKKEGFAPSVRDICAALGWKSTSTVHAYLARLEEKGLIRKESNKSRALKVEKDEEAASQIRGKVPLVGQIAAGSPILAEENIESYFPVPAEILPQGESFILKVKGDSMINVGIYSGDQIFVQSCNTARNGDTVVALIDDSATVKTFYKENNYFRLQPENDTMEPIILNQVFILGKAIGLYRKI